MTTDYAKFTPITEDTKFELKLDENTSCIMTGGQIRAALTPSVEPKSEEECLRTLYENVKDDSMKAFLRTWFEPVECKPNEEHDKEK